MKNYLLLAFKILQRHKFYTCISLFGISMTLMVLILVTSIFQSFVHPQGPEINSDNFLVAGIMTFRQEYESGGRARSIRPLSYGFVEKHVLPMQTPEIISVFSASIGGTLGAKEVVGFKDGVKIKSSAKRTDANYWRILQFEFVDGRPFNEQEHQQGAYVAVISETTRGRFFPGESAVGKTIELDGARFQVIGVVKDVSPLQTFAAADVWLPLFATPSTRFRTEETGGEFFVLLQARTKADLPLIAQEYQVVVRNYRPPLPSWFVGTRPLEVYSNAVGKLQFYTQLVIDETEIAPEDQNGRSIILTVLSAGALMFMLLPVINLVNINISRILDRASEIGVRKSFGASSGHLVRQFIVENLVITAIGGLLGFLLAIFALSLLVKSGLLAGEAFQFNYRVFALGLVYIFMFGVMSAVYPAWKMSRLDPVRALKGAVS